MSLVASQSALRAANPTTGTVEFQRNEVSKDETESDSENGQKLRARPDATVNHEGALAFKPSSQLDLYLRACTCLVEDRFYTKADQQLAELRTAIQACERSYVLKLANYTRNQMHLRTLPMILLAEASVMHSGDSKEAKNDVRSYVPKVVKRADEPGELLAYWIRRVGEGSKAKLPNALKKGLSDALRCFDEYQLAKYNRAGEVKLRDVLMLTHARPDSPERAALQTGLGGQIGHPRNLGGADFHPRSQCRDLE